MDVLACSQHVIFLRLGVQIYFPTLTGAQLFLSFYVIIIINNYE